MTQEQYKANTNEAFCLLCHETIYTTGTTNTAVCGCGETTLSENLLHIRSLKEKGIGK